MLFLPLLLSRRRDLLRSDWLVAGWYALYAASLLAGGASGWNRFHLGLLPALAIASAPGLLRLARDWGRSHAWLYLATAACLNYAALWWRLSY